MQSLFTKPSVLWMLGLMLIGLGLRSWGLDFGLPNDSRPDEFPNSGTVMNNILTPLMMGGDWTLNPHYFNYPSVFYYVTTILYLIYYWIGHLTGVFPDWMSFDLAYQTDPTVFHLILRWLSVISGTLTIPIMYLLGKQLSFREGSVTRKQIGWTVAILTAGSYLAIRNSHFGTVDTLLTLGVGLSLLFILKNYQKPSRSAENLACLFTGLTIGVKYPAVLLLIPLSISFMGQLQNQQAFDWRDLITGSLRVSAKALGIFFLTSPWILLDLPTFIQNIQYEAYHFYNTTFPWAPPAWQFYPQFSLFYGLGGFTCLLSLIGMIIQWYQSKDNSTQRWQFYILLSFFMATLLFLMTNVRVQSRYALPLLPIVLVYSAIGLNEVSTRLQHRFKTLPNTPDFLTKGTLAILLMITLFQPLSDSLALNRILSQPDTRVLARNWLLEHVPKGSAIATGSRLGRLTLPPDYGQILTEPLLTDPQQPNKINLRIMDSRTAQVSAYGNPNMLKQMGVRFVVLYLFEIPVFSNSQRELKVLQQNATLVAQWNSLKRNVRSVQRGVFDPLDAVFFPFTHFEEFQRSGPQILIFDFGPTTLI